MGNEKLERLNARIEQLKNQAKKIESQEKGRQRKDDTRRKLLMGAFLQHWIEKDKAAKEHWQKTFPGFLSREIDRTLFGFDKESLGQPQTGEADAAKEAVA